MKITKLEKIALIEFTKDQYVRDNGWESDGAAAWVDCFSDSLVGVGIEKKSISGVIGSLAKKGIMWTDGEALNLTDKGRLIVGGILENEDREYVENIEMVVVNGAKLKESEESKKIARKSLEKMRWQDLKKLGSAMGIETFGKKKEFILNQLVG